MADGPETQTQTQAATQFATQSDNGDASHLWGILIPANTNNRNIDRIELLKTKSKYTVGRHKDCDIRFDKCLFISSRHCTIEWDGDESTNSAVVLTDTSSNGTYVDFVKVGVNEGQKCKLLKDGSEVVFGRVAGKDPDQAQDDYRFIFRHKACKTAVYGLDSFYDVQHVLGRGSFGTVLKALHKEEGNWYAVKIIPADKIRKGAKQHGTDALSPDTIPQTLRREIDIMGRLEHRNICQFKEVFYESQGISIVLEWVRGGDLLDYIQQNGPLSERFTQYLTYQICDALAYVHGLGIAHRDLKPENILLTNDTPPIAKIADFGLAKVVDTMTVLHTFCGTPAYLAPEIMHGGQGYSHVVDSWSVGVIVYAMLTNFTPFSDSRDGDDISTRTADRRVEWAVLRENGVSQLCEDFINRLLQVDPKERMSLSTARDHPWLAEQARLQHSGASQGDLMISGLPSQLELAPEPDFEQEPATQAESPPALPEASMSSFVSDRMVLDTASIVMASPSALDDGRGVTPSFAIEEEGPSQDEASSYSMMGSQRLMRRSDVIRRAQNMGIELPGPSQEMQARAIAQAAEEDIGPESAAPPEDHPVNNLNPKSDSNLIPPSPERKPSKRKAMDTSSELSPPPEDLNMALANPNVDTNGRGADPADDGALEPVTRTAHQRRRGGGPKVSPKRPAAKKPRTNAPSPSKDGSQGSEVPGLVRRRSSRLASSPSKTKPVSGRQT